MRTSTLAACWAAACLCFGMPVASAQRMPATPADVAQRGGKIASAPKLALAKVADGFHDPAGVLLERRHSRSGRDSMLYAGVHDVIRTLI
jgi:hypothetical protein